jgi:UDP-glucose 4-epimerase|tara:strand:- start:593 stop:1600 length:1008 start_codon:yes stop_codon:yes gene_type:complete
MIDILKTMNYEKDLQEYFLDKKILLFGGAGFIGSILAKEFVSIRSKVVIVDGFVKHTGASVLNIQEIIEKIDLYKCKIDDLDCLPELVDDSDIIIDSMGFTSHNIGVKYPIVDTQINLISHLKLIDALRKAQDKKIIYLGSRGQYGNIKEDVITENTPQNPIDPQGINKTATESFFKFYVGKYGFNVLSLRITNCFGENQKVTGDDIGLVGSLVNDILKGKTVEVYGSDKRKKNIIYVRDCVQIILKLIMTDFDGFEAYNVAGLEVSLKRLLNNIIGNVGRGDYIIKAFPASVKNIDVGEAKFSDEKMRNKIGETEFCDINDSLANTISYFEERL